MSAVINESLVIALRLFSSDGFKAALELELLSWDQNNDGLWAGQDLQHRLLAMGLPQVSDELCQRGWLLPTAEGYQVWGYLDRQHGRAKRSEMQAVRSRAARRVALAVGPPLEVRPLKPTPPVPDLMAALERSLGLSPVVIKAEIKPHVPAPIKPRPRNEVWDVTAQYHGVDLTKPVPRSVASRVSKVAAELKSAGVTSQGDFDALVEAYKRKFPTLGIPSIEALAKHCLPIIKEYKDTGSIAQPLAQRAKGEHNQRIGQEILASLAEKRTKEIGAPNAG